MNNEFDPTGKKPNSDGAKLDGGKPCIRTGVIEYFPRALIAFAEVSEYGAKKYLWNGWESVPDGIRRYGDAGMRHAIKAKIEGETDSESGLLHSAQEAWNALARLELILIDKGKKAIEAKKIE
jgi:hypothetical protein